MYPTITQTFNVRAGEINMNIAKSASKLSGAFITLYRTREKILVGIDQIIMSISL